MRNRGITRGRLFLGTLLLVAAVMTWLTALLMSPYGDETATGVENVRTTIVVFIRNSAIGTLLLSALSGWLLFPRRRPQKPFRDWAIAAVLAVLVLGSLFQLFWLQTAVLH